MANTRFLRSLGPEYDVEIRNLMMQEDPSWIEIERAVRTRWETLKESAPQSHGAGQALMVRPGNWRNQGRRGTGRAGRERSRGDAPTPNRPHRRRVDPEPARATEDIARERDGGEKWPKCWYCHQRGHLTHACPTRVCTICG
ncbi:unnamed protein product, partial [Discosporangium mesarthrocarpum]